MTTDPALAHDAAQMAVLAEHPAWRTFTTYVEQMRADALTRFSNPDETDQYTHHWRGVYTALVDVLALPQTVIDDERRSRQRAEMPTPTPVQISRRQIRFHDP